jgi:hypothetical protein
VTQSEAIAIAKLEAAKNGWAWHEPAIALRRGWFFERKKWEVVSNSDKIGCNVRVFIDDEDGSIIKAAFCPR